MGIGLRSIIITFLCTNREAMSTSVLISMLTLDLNTKTNTLAISNRTTMSLIISNITLSNNRMRDTSHTTREEDK